MFPAFGVAEREGLIDFEQRHSPSYHLPSTQIWSKLVIHPSVPLLSVCSPSILLFAICPSLRHLSVCSPSINPCHQK